MKNLASEVDKAAFETQNLILTDPKGLVHIGKFLDYGSMNKNQKNAYQNAITDLVVREPMRPLRWEDGLALVAQDICTHKFDNIPVAEMLLHYGTLPNQPHATADTALGIGKGVKQILMLFVGDGNLSR